MTPKQEDKYVTEVDEAISELSHDDLINFIKISLLYDLQGKSFSSWEVYYQIGNTK